MKKVSVTWEDACSSEGPYNVNERGFKGLMTESVGWLVEQNKDYVVVSQDVHYQMAANTTRAVITIPRKMVKKIKVLR